VLETWLQILALELALMVAIDEVLFVVCLTTFATFYFICLFVVVCDTDQMSDSRSG
jgi:hypothetical protein